MKFGVSYFGVRDTRYVLDDMKEIKETGFSYVVHTFSEEDFYFYPGTMKEIVNITQAEGLEVFLDPWGVGKFFGGEPPSYFLGKFPRVRMFDKNKNSLGKVCPLHPEFIKFFNKWIDRALETGADGVFFDEPKFEPEGCFCPICDEKLKSSGKARSKFHIESIFNFLEESARRIRSENRKTSICLIPTRYNKLLWERCFNSKNFTRIGTDPYPVLFPENFIEKSREFIRIMKRQNKKKELEIWVQAFGVPNGSEEVYISRIVELCKKENVDTVSFWGFRGCAVMSHLSCENPIKVWETIKQSIYRK